jgi:hypothetical protein
MTRARIDQLMPDLENTPMRGVFHSVTQAEEKALRAAGYVPVLRWVLVLGSGGVSDTAVKTSEALRVVRRRKPTKKRSRR